jgi:hypothetical protein
MLSNATDAVSETIRSDQEGIAHSVRCLPVSLRAAAPEHQIGVEPVLELELLYKSLNTPRYYNSLCFSVIVSTKPTFLTISFLGILEIHTMKYQLLTLAAMVACAIAAPLGQPRTNADGLFGLPLGLGPENTSGLLSSVRWPTSSSNYSV